MQPYAFFDHTADMLFKAYGRTLEEAFSNAALALTSMMIDPKKVKPVKEKKFTVSGYDKKALLYNFLEQFLIFVDSESFILHEVKNINIKKEQEYTLTAQVTGDILNEKYAIDLHVKAITYNDMRIEETKDHCIVQVVPDI
jgi:SHS2 domain-containing protein